MELYYFPELSEDLNLIKFDVEEFHHLVKVKRTIIGDEVFVTNGNGFIARTKLIRIFKNGCECVVVSYEKFDKPDQNLIALIPLLKKIERFEFGIEKLTELGITEIYPYYSARTIKGNIKVERTKKIIISAIKQSFNPFLPKISDVSSFENLLKHDFNDSLILYGDPNGENLFQVDQKLNLRNIKNILITVGPEGDFSESELELLKSKKGIPVKLGKNKLRSETALITLLAQLKIFIE